MNTLQICPPHMSYVATLPWEIQKVIFNIIIHIFEINYVILEETNSNCCTAALAVYLLFNASCYLHSPVYCVCGTLQEERVYWYGHVEASGSGFLWHGLNFSTAWCTVRLISVEKDSKHVLMQKVVTLNTCYDIACLIFQLPHITTGPFQSLQRLKERNKPSVRWKSLAIHKLVRWHFQVG